jgi:hypothetical protein
MFRVRPTRHHLGLLALVLMAGFGWYAVKQPKVRRWWHRVTRGWKAQPNPVSPTPMTAEEAYAQYLRQRATTRSAAVARLPQPPAPPTVRAATSNPIDNFIMAKWKKGPRPRLCDDSVFVRRVFLDVVGYVPPREAVQRFLASKDPAKRATLINDLLGRDIDYAAHWLPFWEEALCSEGGHEGGVKPRGSQRDWILDSFRKNKPYDIFVCELLDPTELLPRPGFVQSSNHLEATQTAANVGQVFLGTGLKCATCHNHFTNKEWQQKQFLAFASLFSANNLEVIRCDVHRGIFVQPSYIFANGKGQTIPKTLEGRLHVAAQCTVDPANPRFARVIVNRLWKRYLGLGLVEPVDDFRADRPGSHPELLEWLAYDFLKNGCDLKHTIRLILNSRTYQLAYDAKLADAFDIQQPDRPRFFRSPSLRRLTCEQLLDSIQLGLKWPGKRTYFREEPTALTLALSRPATRNEVSTGRSEDVAVVQALEIMNGREFHKLIYRSPLVSRLASRTDMHQAISGCHLALLSRRPTAQELRTCRNFLGAHPTTVQWGDLIWALLASPEFQYVH